MEKQILEMSYEECIEALDDVISQLEENTLLLQDAVILFEKGTQLYEQAEKKLAHAQLQVEILTQNTNENIKTDVVDDSSDNAVQDTMFD